MTRPRSELVSLDATPYYHCVSRCVRRAFLCGNDTYTGKNFDHRKPWLLERLALLAEVFAIDVAAYALMSNHYHLVLHVDRARAAGWSMQEVLSRWSRVYKGPAMVQDYLARRPLGASQLRAVERESELIRSKLSDISRFMGCLNEFIARKANAEDRCTGRFWEGRFSSQALLDEKALLSCMAYVDLNPLRAGIAPSVQACDYTSVQRRIRRCASRAGLSARGMQSAELPRLMGFSERRAQGQSLASIPCKLEDYLELVEWTGRVIRKGARGGMTAKEPRLLSSLGLSKEQWRLLALEIQKESITMLNGLQVLERIARRTLKALAA